MKKYHLSLWIIALVGLITSCSRDEAAGPQNEASNRVRIGTSIDQALQTRAASVTIPENHKLRYVLEVWSTVDEPACIYRNEKTTTGTDAVAFDFLLSEAGNYKALLWADFVPDSETGTPVTTPNQYTHYADHHYVTSSASGLKAVTLAKTGADYVINDDARDAFFACLAIEKGTGAFEESVELTRPFGQINVIEKNTALLDKVASMTLAYVVLDKFNVETGATIGMASVKPAVSTLPTATDVRKANLFYDFIFAPATGQTTLGEIALKFESNDVHVTLPDYTIPANMPVVRNKRTNISGSILKANSNDARLTVTVSDAWTTTDEEENLDIPAAKALLDKCKDAGEGDDAAAYTFIITTAEQLAALGTLVNNSAKITGATTALYSHANYVLDADINLENKPWTQGIGSFQKPFKGTFDGGGYHISNLNVNPSTERAGLFGYISDGTVRNLRVSGDVTSSKSHVGGIVGDLSGSSTVENCLFDGNVNGTTYIGSIAGQTGSKCRIARCHTRGTVKASASQAGGIAGSNPGNIEDCYSQAEVGASNTMAGGIAGSNSGTITRCYATGAVSGMQNVGGICGNINGSVTNSLALNPSLTGLGGGYSTFGRIWGSSSSSGSSSNCAAFQSMRLPVTATSDADGKDGLDLAKDACLTAATYATYGFSAENGWAFDEGEMWTNWLPWNPAFKTFSGITEAEYRIAVPEHLQAN